MTKLPENLAKERAAQAEDLADRVEARTERDRELECAIAALLLGPHGAKAHAAKSKVGETMFALVVTADDDPFNVDAPWNGSTRGAVHSHFLTDIDIITELADRLFGGWGWDVIKWPTGQGGPSLEKEPTKGEGHVYDAEVTPIEPAVGRSLIGQHSTAGGALMAAILRAYAYKTKLDADALDPVVIDGVNLDIDDRERGLIHDIVDRAEELELSPPASRVDRMMDIAAVHKNGCPLDLESFLHHATDFAFTHDFTGIVENVDRNTGKLQNEFLPRYSQAETDKIIAAAVSGDQTPNLGAVITGVDYGSADGDATVTVTGSVDEHGKLTIHDYVAVKLPDDTKPKKTPAKAGKKKGK